MSRILFCLVYLLFTYNAHAHGQESSDPITPHQDTPPQVPAVKAAPAKATPTSSIWSYQGINGPQNWGRMQDTYSDCGMGKMQSPIDINYATENKASTLKVNYTDSKLQISNTGYDVTVTPDAGNFINVNGERYDLQSFKFHAPSEHKLNGKYFDMEIQFYHTNSRDEKAVVSILVTKGRPNSVLETIIEHIPDVPKISKTYDSVTINSGNLFPHSNAIYELNGSLTTPPCTEGVKWYVYKEPIEIAPEQLAVFTNYYNNNIRPIQPQNARWITSLN